MTIAVVEHLLLELRHHAEVHAQVYVRPGRPIRLNPKRLVEVHMPVSILGKPCVRQAAKVDSRPTRFERDPVHRLKKQRSDVSLTRVMTLVYQATEEMEAESDQKRMEKGPTGPRSVDKRSWSALTSEEPRAPRSGDKVAHCRNIAANGFIQLLLSLFPSLAVGLAAGERWTDGYISPSSL